jgi:hypothetical protein
VIDTLMVLWTRGTCIRLLRALLVFLLLFMVICVLLFLVTASEAKWPGRAVTAPSPPTTTQHTLYQPPIILQNPTATPVAPTSIYGWAITPIATYRARHRHIFKMPVPPATATPIAMP